MNAKNGDDDRNLVEDARNALLAHFSSKSTNQTVVILGLAVVFFAVIQSIGALNLQLRWLRIAFLTFSLGLVIFFVIRAIGRLLLWGELAGAVIRVNLADSDVIENLLNLEKPKVNLEKLKLSPEGLEVFKKLDVAPTYLSRLSVPSVCYVVARANLFSRIISNKWFPAVYSIVAIAVFILLLMFA
jgi:hypothetical protein